MAATGMPRGGLEVREGSACGIRAPLPIQASLTNLHTGESPQEHDHYV